MPAPIKLGLLPPLTGIVGMYGVEITRAAELACREINDAGGVLGRPLALVIADDGSLPESAVAAADRLVDEGCAALVGNLLSNARIAVAYRVAERRRIPLLNFSFYEGSILGRYFFHFAALPNQQIERMIPFMRERFGPRMYFAGNAYEWPRGSIAAAKRSLEGCGGEVLGERYLPLGADPADLDHLLEGVAAMQPDVFVPYFAGTDQTRLLEQFHARGLKGRVAVVMGHFDEMMASTLDPLVREGFYSSNTYFMTVDTPENHDVLERLAAAPSVTGIWPRGDGILTNFGEGAYICVKAFAAAVARAGSVETESLVDALATVSVHAPQGVVRMTPESQHAVVNSYLSRCEADGSFTIIEAFGALDPELPERYRHERLGAQAAFESDLRLQARILASLSEAVVLVRASDGTVIYGNPAAEALFGCARGILSGRALMATLGGPSLGTASMLSSLRRSGAWQGDTIAIRLDGSALTCAATVSAFTHSVYGEVWLATCRDVSDTRRLSQELERSEGRYRRAERGTNDGLWEWNMITGEEYFSPRWCAILGFERDELRPHVDTFTALVHPEDRPALWTAVERHDRLGELFDIEFRMLHKSGAYVWVRSRGQISREAGVALMTGSISDVSEQKRAELRLREAHRLAGLGAWELDLVSMRPWWSPEQYVLNGVEPGTPISQDGFLRLIHPDDRQRFDAVFRSTLDEGSADIDYRIVRPDGEVRHMHGVATLTRDASGHPIRLSGTNLDVTAHVTAQASIRRSLAEKETLLREIHHRVKNNLQVIASLLHFHAKRLRAPEDASALAELRQRLFAITLVHERLYNSRDAVRVDFGDYVRALVSELRQSTAPRPSIRIEVVADDVQLPIEIAMPCGMIVSELLTNALKYAFPNARDGSVTVRIRAAEERVELEVDDDGVGFPAGFDPRAGGSFGWELVRTLVLQLHGTVEATTDGGARVRVTLNEAASGGRRFQ